MLDLAMKFHKHRWIAMVLIAGLMTDFSFGVSCEGLYSQMRDEKQETKNGPFESQALAATAVLSQKRGILSSDNPIRQAMTTGYMSNGHGWLLPAEEGPRGISILDRNRLFPQVTIDQLLISMRQAVVLAMAFGEFHAAHELQRYIKEIDAWEMEATYALHWVRHIIKLSETSARFIEQVFFGTHSVIALEIENAEFMAHLAGTYFLPFSHHRDLMLPQVLRAVLSQEDRDNLNLLEQLERCIYVLNGEAIPDLMAATVPPWSRLLVRWPIPTEDNARITETAA